MQWFQIADAADQRFDTLLDGKRIGLRLRYNASTSRWSFDLSISTIPVLHGRRIVTGVDLLKPFDFGLGLIFADSQDGKIAPDYDALVSGRVRFYHASPTDIADAGS